MKSCCKASFLLALALLGLSELAVRVFFARNMSGRFEYGYHPSAGFQEGRWHRPLVRAGGRRFHPQSFAKARPPAAFRVMVIGDSVPRGSSLASSYPVLVGQRLQQLGVKAESFNLAVAGNGALRSQIILRQALEYQPSLVILHVNNSNEYEDEREFKRAQQFKGWHPKNWLMKSLVVRRLYEAKTEKVSWEWLPAAIRNQKAVSDADAEIAMSMNQTKLREWDERVSRYTAESVTLARRSGLPVLLLTQAVLGRDSAGKPRLDDHGLDSMVAPLAGPGVLLLSMKQLLEPLAFESLFADGSHLRPEGHRMMAQAIVQLLLREDLVKTNH